VQDAHSKAYKSKEKLARVYENIGLSERAEKVRSCGKTYSFYVCHECGQYCYLAEFRCDDRLCALCGRHRVSRLLESYGGVLKEVKNAKMVTVSMRSRPLGELKLAVKELWDAFSRLRHRSIWKGVRGCIAALEVTFNVGSRTWHPHLHVLLDGDYIDWAVLRSAWYDCTRGEGNAVYIQRARAGWERELIKYVTKVSALYRSSAAIDEFLRFARGRRFIRTYGTLYNCAASREETRGPIVCKGCGAEMHLEKSCVSVDHVYTVLRDSGRRVDDGIEELACKSP
jgi:Replication protein